MFRHSFDLDFQLAIHGENFGQLLVNQQKFPQWVTLLASLIETSKLLGRKRLHSVRHWHNLGIIHAKQNTVAAAGDSSIHTV